MIAALGIQEPVIPGSYLLTYALRTLDFSRTTLSYLTLHYLEMTP